jgi:uroporphyrinogen III methyltransferase/synthase
MAPHLAEMVAAGLGPGTPAAAVERGTHPRQRTVVATAATLAQAAHEAGIAAPALVIVGDAVALRRELAWFERRPLAGRTVVVTRPRAQAGGFAAALEEMGAEVVPLPAIRIAPAPDPEPLRQAVRCAGTFDWIVFTSVNGVARFFAALADAGRDARALAPARIAAIGPATAAELAKHAIIPDLVPGEYVAEAAVEALAAEGVAGKRVLLPRAEIARAVLPDELRARGAEVVDVAAYRTVPDGEGAAEVRRRLDAGEIDWVTFTASSTVRTFAELVGADVGRARVASIGPVTSGTARELGMRVDVEAAEYTIPGLLAALRFHVEGGD